MIAREKADDGFRITQQDMDDRHGYCDSCPAIQRLLDDTGIARVSEFLTVIAFVGMRHDRNLAVSLEEWVEAGSSLTKQTVISHDAAELLRPGVPGDPSCQISQTNSVSACQEHGPKMPRRFNATG